MTDDPKERGWRGHSSALVDAPRKSLPTRRWTKSDIDEHARFMDRWRADHEPTGQVRRRPGAE